MVNCLLAIAYCNQHVHFTLARQRRKAYASVFKYRQRAYEHAIDVVLTRETSPRNASRHISNELSKVGTKICLSFEGEREKDKSSHHRNVTDYRTHTHTHTRLFHSVCLAANIIMVLTALVNSSTQNKLSGSVGASSGEFHSKVCVCASAYARVSVRVRVRILALNYNPLFQPPHSQLDLSSAVKISAEANSKGLSGANVTFVFSLFLPPLPPHPPPP